MRKSLGLIVVLAFGVVGSPANVSAIDENLKPEELVARHLAAIGSAEARGGITSRAIAGAAHCVLRLGGEGGLKGPGNILSDSRRVRIGLRFTSHDYAGEQLAFDGRNVTVGLTRPGERSALAQFVYNHDVVLKEGLLGGVLSAAWPLLDTGKRQPKLESAGSKNVDGRQVNELKYRSRKGRQDLQISLYFDSATFRHVMTQYRLEVPSGMPAVPGRTPPRNTFHTLVEYFNDFRQVDGVTLPHSYRFVYTIDGLQATYLADWTLQGMKIGHNAPMQDAYFEAR